MNLTWWAGQRRRRHVLAKMERRTADAQPFTCVARPGAPGGAAAPQHANADSALAPAGSGGATASPHPLAAAAAGGALPSLRADGSGGSVLAARGASGQALQPAPSVLSRYWGLHESTPNAFALGMLRGDLALALRHPTNPHAASPLVRRLGPAKLVDSQSAALVTRPRRGLAASCECVGCVATSGQSERLRACVRGACAGDHAGRGAALQRRERLGRAGRAAPRHQQPGGGPRGADRLCASARLPLYCETSAPGSWAPAPPAPPGGQADAKPHTGALRLQRQPTGH